MLQYNNRLKEYSRRLRKNITDAEKMPWLKIRGKQLKGYQFYRQKPIGNFIVDFYCPQGNLVIEIDGGQHYSEEGKAKDDHRDKYMEGMGLRVLRFSDREIFENLRGVIDLPVGRHGADRRGESTGKPVEPKLLLQKQSYHNLHKGFSYL